jgi:hypothetical protein
MEKKDLIQKIARLESVNDQLVAEIRYLDEIARNLGFCDGLRTLKAAAIELLEIEKQNDVKAEGKDEEN